MITVDELKLILNESPQNEKFNKYYNEIIGYLINYVVDIKPDVNTSNNLDLIVNHYNKLILDTIKNINEFEELSKVNKILINTK
jgi:hypothetical protein